MLTVALCRAVTSPEECWKATVCASLAQLSSACVGHTADGEVGAKPGSSMGPIEETSPSLLYQEGLLVWTVVTGGCLPSWVAMDCQSVFKITK